MKKDPMLENLWLFERYAGGEMDEEERRTFEERLSAEKELEEAYREYKILYDAISDREALELRKKLRKIEEQYRKKNDGMGGVIRMGIWYWLAATLIIAGGVTLFLMIHLKSSNPMAASYADYMKTDSMALQGPRFELPDNYYMLKEMAVRGDEFVFQGPRDSAVFRQGDPVELRWELKKRLPLTLTLYDSEKHAILHSIPVHGNSMRIRDELPPGIYIYYFSHLGEIWHVGVFFVRR